MLNKMLKWRKKNSKGFSLIELIIVIAIMAILVGILAPQFVKYVNQSRISTDKKNLQEVISAVNVYCADPDTKFIATAGTDGTVALGSFTLAASAAATAGTDDVAAAMKAAGLDQTKITAKSTDLAGTVITARVNSKSNVEYKITLPSGKAATASPYKELLKDLGIGTDYPTT
jgi:type IV pilus assembly protein PilA